MGADVLGPVFPGRGAGSPPMVEKTAQSLLRPLILRKIVQERRTILRFAPPIKVYNLYKL